MFRNWKFNNANYKEFNTSVGFATVDNSKTGYLRSVKVEGNTQPNTTDIPSPTNPISLHSVGDFKMHISNKNLFPVGTVADYYVVGGALTIDGNILKKLVRSGASSWCLLQRKYAFKQGTISAYFGTNLTSSRFLIRLYDYEGNNISSDSLLVAGWNYNSYYQGYWAGNQSGETFYRQDKRSFILPDGVAYYYLGFIFNGITGEIGEISDIMFTTDSEQGSYVLNEEQSTFVQLKDIDGNPIELYSDAAGTKDEIDVDNGVLIKRVGKYTYKNGDGWYINSYGNNNFAYLFSATNDLNIGLSQYKVVRNTHFKTGYSSGESANGSWVNHNYNYTTLFCAYPFADMGDGVAAGDNAALKAWLTSIDAEYPFEIYYPLGKVQIIPLHEDTINTFKQPTTPHSSKSYLYTETDNGVQPNLKFNAISGGK